MKGFFQNSAVKILAVCFVLGLTGPITAYAATAPALGDAASFSILGAANMTSANITTISGDLGISPGVAGLLTGTWTHTGGANYFGVGGLSQSAEAAALAAYGNLVGQVSSGVWSTDPIGGINNPEPGVWTETASPVYSGTLTLNGGYDDVWVFKLSTDFTFTGSVVLAGNAQACNVFWSVAGDATLNPGSNFVGTLIAQNDITSASGATINGRIISLTGTTIAMNGSDSSITGPTCAVAPPLGGPTPKGTINVVKAVINDNGGTKTIADFNLTVNGLPTLSGVTNVYDAEREYYVSEDADSQYTKTFSGDCDSTGKVILRANDVRVCIITNDDIGAPAAVPPVPPLIDVVKVPNPLALPTGPGSVTYTYTVRNIGTVPMTDITLVGDTCSPIALISGDVNSDTKLDVDETWTYRCMATLSETHTNTVVATGWANGMSATDIAHATVIVGASIVPPLIHVTKVPSPLTLPVGGGMVTYTKKVTNPGTVALSNVYLTDDKCSSVKYVSGDTNSDSKLDTTETWTYTCQTNLTKTTLNTVTASGDANGMIARDYAVATVVVASVVPALPNTGIPPAGNSIMWVAIIFSGVLLLAAVAMAILKRKQTV
jgi:uncharacterized repeat protein (TIGR01451 family)